jgi:hypothetical protein
VLQAAAVLLQCCYDSAATIVLQAVTVLLMCYYDSATGSHCESPMFSLTQEAVDGHGPKRDTDSGLDTSHGGESPVFSLTQEAVEGH